MAIKLQPTSFVKIISGFGRRARGGEDRPVVGLEHLQPAGEVAGVIRARAGGKAKVAAKES